MARTPYLAVSPALRRSNGHGEWQPVIRFIQSCFTELLTVLVTCRAGASDLLGSYVRALTMQETISIFYSIRRGTKKLSFIVLDFL